MCIRDSGGGSWPGTFVPTFAGMTIVGWCGMRGIVTLATAFALPEGGNGHPPFPYRELILLCAFAVVAGTLVVQGLTLRPLIVLFLSLIHISEPTRLLSISYAVFCLK